MLLQGIDSGEYSRTLMSSAKRTVTTADKTPTPLQVLTVAHRSAQVNSLQLLLGSLWVGSDDTEEERDLICYCCRWVVSGQFNGVHCAVRGWVEHAI